MTKKFEVNTEINSSGYMNLIWLIKNPGLDLVLCLRIQSTWLISKISSLAITSSGTSVSLNMGMSL